MVFPIRKVPKLRINSYMSPLTWGSQAIQRHVGTPFFHEMVVELELQNHSLIYVLLAKSTGFYTPLAILLFLNNYLPLKVAAKLFFFS
jgi:hypothetical protein